MAINGHICIRHLGNALRKVARSVPAEYGLKLSYRIDADLDGERCMLMVSALGCVQADAPLELAGKEHYSEAIGRAMFRALMPIIENAHAEREDNVIQLVTSGGEVIDQRPA